MDNVHAVRNQVAADIVVLLTKGTSYSGIAGAAAGLPATESSAFAVSRWDLAVTNLTFAHEVAHLVGGRHENDSSSPNPWARGYSPVNNNWRTVMHTYTVNGYRVPYFSNPGNSALGSPHGTSTNDVGRVWEERGAIVEGFRVVVPGVDPPSNLTITNAGNIHASPNLSWTASTTPGVTYEVQRCTSYYQSCNWQTLATTTSTSYTDFGLQISTQANADDEYRYQVKASAPGLAPKFSNTYATWGITPFKGFQESVSEVDTPGPYSLSKAYPNPFNPETRFSFTVGSRSDVQVTLHDVTGRAVQVLATGAFERGEHSVRFDAGNLPSGTYLVRATMQGAEGTDYAFTQMLTLLK